MLFINFLSRPFSPHPHPSLFSISFFSGALLGFEILILAVWMGVDPPMSVFVPSGDELKVQSCSPQNPLAWWVLVIGPKALLLLVGVYLAYKVRHLNTKYVLYCGVCV